MTSWRCCSSCCDPYDVIKGLLLFVVVVVAAACSFWRLQGARLDALAAAAGVVVEEEEVMMMRHNTHSGGREEGVMPYPALLRSCAQPSPRHRPHPWPSSQTYARDTKIYYVHISPDTAATRYTRSASYGRRRRFRHSPLSVAGGRHIAIHLRTLNTGASRGSGHQGPPRSRLLTLLHSNL